MASARLQASSRRPASASSSSLFSKFRAFFCDANQRRVELLENAPYGDPDLHAYAQETARVLLQTGVAVSAAHAVAALRRIAVAADRRAIIADVRAALRDSGDPCHTAWNNAGEIEGRPDPATED